MINQKKIEQEAEEGTPEEDEKKPKMPIKKTPPVKNNIVVLLESLQLALAKQDIYLRQWWIFIRIITKYIFIIKTS